MVSWSKNKILVIFFQNSDDFGSKQIISEEPCCQFWLHWPARGSLPTVLHLQFGCIFLRDAAERAWSQKWSKAGRLGLFTLFYSHVGALVTLRSEMQTFWKSILCQHANYYGAPWMSYVGTRCSHNWWSCFQLKLTNGTKLFTSARKSFKSKKNCARFIILSNVRVPFECITPLKL